MIEISKAIIKKDDKYLLIKRASHSKSFPGTWDFPGGKIDPGETPGQAVVRGTMEEISFKIEPEEELKIAEYHDDEYNLLFYYFIPEVISGELKLSSEHSDFMWVTEEGAKELELNPCVELFFEK